MMNLSKIKPVPCLYAIGIYLISLMAVYQLMDFLSLVYAIPNEKNLLNWDSKWYYSILEEGYRYQERTCNLAFFPLFSYFWKSLGLSIVGISFLNFIIFLLSFWIGTQKTSFSIWSLLFVLVLPSNIFFALPYSESLFFFFSMLIVVGIKEDKIGLQALGFTFASLTRSVSLIFIPALLITFFFSGRKKKIDVLINIGCCLLGTILVAIMQYLHTGKWLYFLEVQKQWGRSWGLPNFPLTTFNADNILALDISSLALGMVSIYILLKYFYLYFFKTSSKRNLNSEDLATIFCCLYVGAVVFLDVFFTRSLSDKTNIWSLNRHVISTFFGAWLLLQQQNKKGNLIDIYIKTGIAFFVFAISELYRHPSQILFYFVFISWFYIGNRHQDYLLRGVILIFIIYEQIVVFQEFLLNKWVG
ncbi:MAG: hypothetical protein K0S24_3244 [Sphingobacterium sp.]|jgi:Gpi18-like mannosyltransferase|nr:hypothetical protein [Sphingobacterium sp.]